MSEAKSYTELELWKEARKLVKEIYSFTRSFPENEKFGLTLQMRRCAVSIPSNIAEGIGRNHANDVIQFLHIARGSLYELETQLLLAADLEICNKEMLTPLVGHITVVKKLLNGYIKYKRTAP